MAQHGPVAIFSAFPGEPASTQQPFGPWEHFNIRDMSYAEPEHWRDYLFALRPWGHEACDRYFRPAAAQQLQALLQSFQPDWVVLGEPWMYRYWPMIRAFTHKIIFDNHNVEAQVSLYQDRLPRRPGLRAKLEARLRHQQVLNMERTLCRRSRQVWVCSNLDQAELTQLYGLPPQQVSVIPNGIDIDRFEPVRENRLPLPAPLKLEDTAILFAATFDYSANIWAAEWLLTEIYPRLQQQRPDLKLMLVGRAPTPLMQAAAQQNSNIIVPGIVDDILPYYQAAAAVVVPLRHGSGTRLKLLEAFAAKRAVVSTAKGAEGLEVIDGQHLKLAETAEAIANQLLQLLQDNAQAQQLQDQAFALVRSQHSWELSQSLVQQSMERLGSVL